MTDEGKTRDQLLEALAATRKRVSELEAATKKLSASEAAWRGIVGSMPGHVITLDTDLNIEFANDTMTGRPVAERIGTGFLSHATAEHREHTAKLLKGVLETSESASWQGTHPHPDGFVFHYEARAVARLVEEAVVGLTLHVSNITERKRAEEALRDSEAQKRAILDGISSNIAFVNQDLEIQWANKVAADSVGRSPEELIGKKCHALWADPDKPCEDCPSLRAFETKKSEHTIMVTPDGRVWDEGGEPVFDAQGDLLGVVEVATDITERKRAEEQRRKLEAQIQQAQKLESLGVLAGGIAHDFNNILTGLLGNADLALCDIPSQSPIRPLLIDIQQAGRRAADLTGQMLAYSGKGRFVVEDIDINALLRDMSSLLESSTSKKVTLSYDLCADLPAVRADATQLRQIALNLVSNASEAVGDEGGVVRVTTYMTSCDRVCLEGASSGSEQGEGHYVTLEVTDSGCGMDEETKARVFDPFFTTKFTGRGLGLAAVQGIVRGHQGAILLESELGKGTTFKVLLPALDHPAEVAAADAKSGAWHGTGTILVVDDEETVRVVATRMLERAGLSVLTAPDGAEAVALFRARQDEINCVLLDLKMPRMDGEETFEELRKIKDDLPVILSSGYSQEDSTKRFADKGLAGFIQKPYESATLTERVREALASRK